MRVALLAIVLGGCSFAFVRGTDSKPPCEYSIASPIVDTVLAAGAGLLAYAALSDAAHGGDPFAVDVEHDVGGGSVLFGAVYGFSAVYGWVTTQQCVSAGLLHDAPRPLKAPDATSTEWR